MTKGNTYDLAVIGAGPGGYVAAVRAAQYGMKTVVVENRELGGTCLNRGCIPTKTFLHAAAVLREIHSAAVLGIEAEKVRLDLARLMARKEEVVQQLQSGIGRLFQAHRIDLVNGAARITGDRQLTVSSAAGEEVLTAENILIATGSLPARPPVPGMDLPGVITSDELLSGQEKIGDSLVIIGGGVIGVELATACNAFGCEVTIIEALDRILPTMDREISQNLTMILKKRGVRVHTAAVVEKIEREGQQDRAQAGEGQQGAGREGEGLLTCRFQEKGTAKTVSARRVLVATGRQPNSRGLVGEGLALAMARGAIIVDDSFRTSLPHVYAIGDVIGGLQLAHVASAQGLNAVAAMAGKPAQLNLAAVPACVYTDPEIATVGLTAAEAEAKGIAVRTGKFLMAANGKSLITQQERGFIKVVFDRDTDILLGAQLMCGRATDLIGELAAAVGCQLTRRQLAGIIRPHPTFAEGVSEAVTDVEKTAIHVVYAK
jgi:dihydrolipoamide dehydrogenase